MKIGKDLDDKELAIVCITTIALWAIMTGEVSVIDVVTHSITGIAGLAVGKQLGDG